MGRGWVGGCGWGLLQDTVCPIQFKQYFIHIQSKWDQAAGLAYFSPLPNSLPYGRHDSFNIQNSEVTNV
jgi:hypothetical protein